MKPKFLFALATLAFGISHLSAATLYVSSQSLNPTAPYATWATAATNIQDAVNAAAPGAIVIVTNGLYAGGLAVAKPLTLLSVNGPQFTVIDASLVSFWNRCVTITNGVSLSGFTLTNGIIDYGGGVWCATTNAFLTNCVIAGNRAQQSGGGAYGATLYHCNLSGNTATNGSGGAYSSALINCVVSNNLAGAVSGCFLRNSLIIDNARFGGGAVNCSLYNCTLIGNGFGAVSSKLYNCIIYFNPPSGGANYDPPAWGPPSSTLNYCCTTPLPPTGIGNITNEPAFAGLFQLSASSACRGGGSAAYASGVDLNGESWLNPPSIGCDEFHSGSATGALILTITASWTNFAAGFTIKLDGTIIGNASETRWEFGDGTVESNRLHTTHRWLSAGDYPVVLRAYNNDYPAGVTTMVVVHVVTVPVHYVNPNSGTPVAPYTNWNTAATTIQPAVDAATLPGSLVLVSNGVYQVGSPVSVNIPLTLQSLNGPGRTAILGSQAPAVRCITLNTAAVLNGFTLTNGSSPSGGGGVYCSSTNAVVTNCVIIGNFSTSGAGAYSGTLNNCVLSSNVAAWAGGGASSAILNHCMLIGNTAGLNAGGAANSTLNYCSLIGNRGQNGGAADWSTLNNCRLLGNSAQHSGGGVYGGTLNNCLVSSNSCGDGGGGTASANVNNCTLTGNTAGSAFYYAGGAYACTVNNSIVYDNSPPNHYYSIVNYCCTTPMPDDGVGNITNLPLFVSPGSGDFHLQPNSPCINAGHNALAAGLFTDLDGNPRIVGGTVDIGAYEFPTPGSSISYAWLQQYGFPTDGSADSADPDHDGMNNWQEWVCGTNPTNSLAALRFLSATRSGSDVALTWQSVAGINYFLERSASIDAWGTSGSLESDVEIVATNITGLAGTTTYTDTNSVTPGPFFYRVGVKRQ